MTWHGWLWIEPKWRHSCQGDSLGRCARLLEQARRRLKVPDKFALMTGGGCPSFVPGEASGVPQESTSPPAAGGRPDLPKRPLLVVGGHCPRLCWPRAPSGAGSWPQPPRPGFLIEEVLTWQGERPAP
jgi:hypothetical protein